MDKPRVVFDCNIYLQALLNPEGIAGRCLSHAFQRHVSLWASPYVFREFRRVATSADIGARFPHATSESVASLIHEVGKVATVARNVPRHFKSRRDPADEHYIDLAVFADATFLVTRDGDLRDLMTGHSDEAKQFRQLSRNQIRVTLPLEFLKDIESRLGND